eukprot:TRINITY_DN9021_c0_g1_i1.p1 TRINITY_DN9021_c0_g1~~TRINITY_DN9021_c0_g1_i1.p1  ORF type:complete len:619 (-),score=142.43 TRINITY_DN9021_c0_g1_i1:11-1867(-)
MSAPSTENKKRIRSRRRSGDDDDPDDEDFCIAQSLYQDQFRRQTRRSGRDHIDETIPENPPCEMTMYAERRVVREETVEYAGEVEMDDEEADALLAMLKPKMFDLPEELPVRSLENIKSTADKEIDAVEEKDEKERIEEEWKDGHWVNCDLRYFPLSSLGKFDVVLLDPPWRLRGNQNMNNNESTMFANCNFTLEYNTLSNEEILDVDVGCLSDAGFLFLWAINSQLPLAFQCMNRWGYTYIDKITWVKKTVNENLGIGQGYYFLHSTEECLVGVKCSKEKNIPFISKVSTDVIFGQTRRKSQKPEQMYNIIERMIPGGKKIELFARNHNLRRGWLSLGNQLGQHFDWDQDSVNCDSCAQVIEVGTPRYKSRKTADFDICDKCFLAQGLNPEDFFKLDNILDEMVFHEWFKCNCCAIAPLWGIRFHCDDCTDLDICEECYNNKRVSSNVAPNHKEEHHWSTVEVPERAGGFSIHYTRCSGCNTAPIIGYRFLCCECSRVNLCQKCFFMKKTPKMHDPSHRMELCFTSDNLHRASRCLACGKRPIVGVRYVCDSCFNYSVCDHCYRTEAPPPMSHIAHKSFHKFSAVQGDLPPERWNGGKLIHGNGSYYSSDSDEDYFT